MFDVTFIDNTHGVQEMGFDNLDVSEYIQPALTTVNQDQVYFGSRLWEISKRVLKTNECINDTIMQNLIIRSSC